MMKKRTVALLLAGTIALSLCGGAVLAAGQARGDISNPPQDQTAQGTEGTDAPQTPGVGLTLAVDETGEGPATQEGAEEAQPEAEPEPDPAGVLSFANLEARVRAGNLNYLILEESIAQLDAYDYEKMQEDLRKALNGIANAQWQLHTSGSQIQLPPGMEAIQAALQGMASASASATSQSLQAQYDALREQFDDLKDGKLQKDIADAARQLRNTQNSILKTMEAVYAQLEEGYAGLATLDRALAALDRSIRELELRYELGQVSALTLQQVRASRTSLASQRQSVAVSLETGVMNLESQLGLELTGALRLAALPTVTDSQLSAMELERDLAAAKELSYDLYAAKKTLDDAQEDFKDAGKEYSHNEKKYQYVQAQHAWQAAQYTYDAAVQSFELSFRTLYAQVKDYAQVLTAANTALAVEQSNYAVDQLKHEQGTISQNALLAAQDDVDTAKDTVASAERNLFAAYNNYRWAVEHGILN